MDIVYRHIEFVTWILSIVTSLLSIVILLLSIVILLLSIAASMLSHVHHRIARPLGPPYLNSCPDQTYISNKTEHFSLKVSVMYVSMHMLRHLKGAGLGYRYMAKKLTIV